MLLGGGFGEPDYMFHEGDRQSPWDRKPNYGFRCVKLPSPPPPAAVARIEERETTEEWTRENVSFNAAYGEERVVAHIYLPRNAAPPYQAVVYFPGSGAQHSERFNPARIWGNDFIPKSGRALLFPIYKGIYERRVTFEGTDPRKEVALRRRLAIELSNDLGRSLDYLETRSDIDSTRLAYSGFSWGAHLSPVLLSVDPRFRTAILAAGGMLMGSTDPERDRINFLPRLRIPVLMLNGRYDELFPVDTSQRPFFRLLGTPEKDKKHVLYDTGHIPPNREAIRDSLDWLDRYLGPVKRQPAPAR